MIIDPLNPPLGIHPGVSETVYRQSAGVCQSNLKLVEVSLAHYRVADTAPWCPPEIKQLESAQEVGTIVHGVTLESRWDCAVKPEGMKLSTKEGKAWKAAQKTPWVSHADFEHIAGMVRSIKAHPEAAKMLYGKGDNEVACWRRCPLTGLLLKGRADRLTMDDRQRMTLIDIKTCQLEAAQEYVFQNEIGKWGYYRQAAFYIDLFEASSFIIVAVEKEPPYAVATYEIDPEDIMLGRTENNRDLQLVKHAEETGEWPAYSPKIKRISLPERIRRRIRGEEL